MKPTKHPDCNCTNCDRSCCKQAPSGTNFRRTSRKEAVRRLGELKKLVGGAA